MAKLDYDAALGQLKVGSGNLRCSEVRDILHALGFTVRDGKKGGHKTFSHSSIHSFTGGNYNCGHGKNPQVGKAYIANIIDILERYSDEIKTYLSKH